MKRPKLKVGQGFLDPLRIVMGSLAKGVTPLNRQGVSPLNTQGVTPLNTQGVTPLNTQGVTPLNTQGVSPLVVSLTALVRSLHIFSVRSLIFSVLFIAFLIIPTSLGFSFTKVGTTAAPFLKIECGARPVAMGGSFVALANDPSGIYYNPAGIAELKKTYIAGGHTEWFAELNHDYAIFVLPTNRINYCLWGSFLTSGDIEITTIENPEGTGQHCNYIDGLLGFTVSMFVSDRLSIGLSGKYIQQKLYNESASTIALDVGSILRTPFKGLRLGMCMTSRPIPGLILKVIQMLKRDSQPNLFHYH
jgi:hypothetical protein